MSICFTVSYSPVFVCLVCFLSSVSLCVFIVYFFYCFNFCRRRGSIPRRSWRAGAPYVLVVDHLVGLGH